MTCMRWSRRNNQDWTGRGGLITHRTDIFFFSNDLILIYTAVHQDEWDGKFNIHRVVWWVIRTVNTVYVWVIYIYRDAPPRCTAWNRQQSVTDILIEQNNTMT